MRSFFYWFQVIRLFIARFKRLLFIGVFAGIIVFLFFSAFPSAYSFFVKRDVIGFVGRYSVDDLPLQIQNEISFGLTKIDEKSNVVPGLAESWETQNEGRVWLFYLGDFKWQDGSRVLAKDIVYKFSDVETEVIGEKTIKFSLKDPFSPFPSVVSRPVFKRGLLGVGDSKVLKITNITGGKFIESIKLSSINKSSTDKEYRFYPTEDAARIAFKLAEVTKLNNLVDPKELKDWKNLNISPKIREDLYAGVFINNQDPIFSDKSARQALAYAIDKDKFDSERALGPISPFSWAYNPQIKQYNYNPKRARELLSDLPKEQRNNLSIQLATTPTLLSYAEKIKSDWDEIGVSTKIQVSNTVPESFQALLAIQAIPPDPDQYSSWHSTQEQTNITKYKNSKESQRIDKLLEDGRRILDQEERKKIYLDFQRFLVEDCPVIFLFHPTTYSISKNN